MARILVTGNAGSGKSSLSRRLGDDCKLPVYSLDNIVWQPGWKKTPPDIKQKEIAKIISNEVWIVGGVSTQVLESAQIIVFLDIPLRRCLANIIARFLKNGLKTREELPENCPEYVGVFKAIKVALWFDKKMRVKTIALSRDKTFFHIRSYEELRACYSGIINSSRNASQESR